MFVRNVRAASDSFYATKERYLPEISRECVLYARCDNITTYVSRKEIVHNMLYLESVGGTFLLCSNVAYDRELEVWWH